MNEVELARIEARIAAAPDAVVDDATRGALAEARALPGDDGVRAAVLWRIATAATWAAADPARRLPPIRRTEGAFAVAAETRAKLATYLGFPDAWALARAIAGEPDEPPLAPPPPWAESQPGATHRPDEARLREILADPGLVVARLADAHGVRPGVIRVELGRGPAPEPGRTFVVAPGRDVRIKLWWRPEAGARGVLRVLLHEVGHAVLAAGWGELPFGLAAAPSHAFDEGAAAWMCSHLEREAFLADVVGLDAGAAAEVAAAERAVRAARRARLATAAAAEHAFYRAGGPAPWREALAWTAPGHAASYAAGEAVRDDLDARLGAGWPTASLGPIASRGARG